MKSIYFAFSMVLLLSSTFALAKAPKGALEGNLNNGDGGMIYLNKNGKIEGLIKNYLKAFSHSDKNVFQNICFRGDEICDLFDELVKKANKDLDPKHEFKVRDCSRDSGKMFIDIRGGAEDSVATFSKTKIKKCEKFDPYDQD